MQMSASQRVGVGSQICQSLSVPQSRVSQPSWYWCGCKAAIRWKRGFCARETGKLVCYRHGMVGQRKRAVSVLRTRQGEHIPPSEFDSIESALVDIASGKFVVVLDDENRENEGDLIIAADKVTTESMAYMIQHTSGVVCVAMQPQDLKRLQLPLMVSSDENEESMYTAFTVSVDLRNGTSTGISAADRAATIQALARPDSEPSEFRRPGHIFPLKYREGGVLVRPGHTEAALDLAQLAGCYPAGVLCEVVNMEDGSMARTPQLLEFARRYGLKCITIADLIWYRLRQEGLVRCTASTQLHTPYGTFEAKVYSNCWDNVQHLALVYGNHESGGGAGCVSLHHDSSILDILGSAGGGCPNVGTVLRHIVSEGRGVFLHLGQDPKTRANVSYQLQQYFDLKVTPTWNCNGALGASSTPKVYQYAAAAQILRHLGCADLPLLAPSALDEDLLRSFGLKVATRTEETSPM